MRAAGLLLVLGAGLSSGPPTLAVDEIAEGRALVITYCADCHAIDPSGASPFAEAPPFRTLGERYDVNLLEEALVEGLVSAHDAMPEFEFDPEQARAIIAYLESLQRAAPSN